MSRYWNSLVGRLNPYIPGEQPDQSGFTKLNTNELPFPPSPLAIAAMQNACNADIRFYPDPGSHALRQTIARLYQCDASNVFVGNGSDEVLGHAFRALMRDDAPVLFADVTYGFYPVYCQLFGLPFEQLPLTEDFKIDLGNYIGRPSGGVVIANPNANTGRALSLNSLKQLLDNCRNCTVLIDEAYVDFGAQSAASLIKDYPQLVVVQTLSKSRGLAGLRVGFAMAQPHLIEGMTRVKDSFNSYPLSRIAQAGAIAALEDTRWLEKTVSEVCRLRDNLSADLKARGFEVLPSEANFLLARHDGHPAAALTQKLRLEKIIVRNLSNMRISDWIRITTGTEAQHRALLLSLDKIMNFPPPQK